MTTLRWGFIGADHALFYGPFTLGRVRAVENGRMFDAFGVRGEALGRTWTDWEAEAKVEKAALHLVAELRDALQSSVAETNSRIAGAAPSSQL